MSRTKLPVLGRDDIDRRDMMKLLAAGAALATGSLGGCMSKPKERIMPRVEQPPEMTPGLPLTYATTMVVDGFGTGLVIKTHEARPTKIEGNPDHPASLGGTNAFHQASVLELYDPDRPKAPTQAALPTTRSRVLHAIAARERMEGLWFLLHPQSSPLVAEQIARIRTRHPGARFAFYAPHDRSAVYRGSQRAFGQVLECQYHFDRADLVVSLGADFMSTMPNATRWARDFAKRRTSTRLYVAETKPSPTGSLADHRLPSAPSESLPLALALWKAVRGEAGLPDLSSAQRRWITAAAADLVAHRGRALVVVGDQESEEVHELGHAINEAIGGTLDLTQPALIEPLGDGLAELSRAIDAGQVHTLVIVEANPVYTAPGFGASLMRVRETICAALDRHETAVACGTFLPLSHFLESWGDARAYDGTLSIVQPVIRRMYDSVGTVELLAAFAGDAEPSAHELIKMRYGDELPRILQIGAVPASASPPVPPPRSVTPAPVEMIRGRALELAFHISPSVYDGRFANNAWLQELPKPDDKVTWGNVATLAPETARSLHIAHEDLVLVTAGDQTLVLPAYVLPGHAEGCVSLELGYGRAAAGAVGNHVGVNVYALRSAQPVSVRPAGKRGQIAATQREFAQHGRDIALDHPPREVKPDLSMLPAQFEDTPKWRMTIDTSICTGCSACVVACVAENNIPVVGRAGVIANREMHWIRIDTYRDDEGSVVHQPMMCQHCEDAPCEYVCPTYATQHSPDGLNEMVYNRCIGTRFCSNNCPYKVRRFNWFDYTEDTAKTLQLQRNPNVTVRARGVMEKCTYCVQRIRSAEIEARKQHRDIKPGEVVTACQQACPTRAIEFGLSTHIKRPADSYFVLEELGTRPSTAYLPKLKR